MHCGAGMQPAVIAAVRDLLIEGTDPKLVALGLGYWRGEGYCLATQIAEFVSRASAARRRAENSGAWADPTERTPAGWIAAGEDLWDADKMRRAARPTARAAREADSLAAIRAWGAAQSS